MRALAIVAAAATVALASACFAQSPAQPAPLAALDPVKLSLDQLEATIHRDGLSVADLLDLRDRIVSLRDDLHARSAEIGPRLDQVNARLKQLGPPPAKDAPPEDPAIAAERAQLVRLHGELDAASKQARLLELRIDQLFERGNERRRAIFTRELLARSSSILDPFFWIEAASSLPGELRSVGILLRSWWGYAEEYGGHGRMAAAFATYVLLAVAAIVLGRWMRRRAVVRAPAQARFAKALAGLRTLAEAALGLPLVVVAVIMTLNAYGLLPARLLEIGKGLMLAVLVAAVGRGVAGGVLAPDDPARRLPALDDASARRFHRHMTWGVRALATALLLNAVHKEIVAPFALTIATSALLALVVAALTLHALLRGRGVDADTGAEAASPARWLRAAAWIVIAAIAVALVTGYIGFALFLAERLLSALVVLGALYLLFVLIDAMFAEMLTADTPRVRAIAGSLGLTPRGVELLGTLLSAVLRLLLVVVATFFAIGPRGILAVEVFQAVQGAIFGFRIGEMTISLTAILGAVAVLLVGLVATRALQRWLEKRLLPRTGLDPGLQHSVSAILGYLGFIAAAAFALAELGIDLQKIALVAGALSVGIGFGLQSIVSNFVSGLILLAERPIRVGDTIVVKGEEGYVRRISVRATEIETFERASVIIPNSELISGVVKNWTHANTTGRIIVKVGVAYDSDPDAVRDILVACARDHPQIMQVPAPRVLLMAFGASALELELRCVVTNVDNALVVRSDLHFAILRRFRAAGIAIPYPQREVRLLAEGAAPIPSVPT